MATIEQIISRKQYRGPSSPVILDPLRPSDARRLREILGEKHVCVSDTYRSQECELFAAQNPALASSPDFARLFESYFHTLLDSNEEWQLGKWVYFPWLSLVSHILEEESFQMVRSSRNRELITPLEQKAFYDARIGIGGLSVGNSAALAIVLMGGAKRIRLADFDTLALSNLNRIRSGVESLGLPKTELTARQIYALNPYTKIELFREGLSRDNIGSFCKDLDVVIDEMDSMPLKYLLRREAKKRRIPVVMAADCANTGIVDVERYDLDNTIEPFHGRLPALTATQLQHLDKRQTGRLIAKHVGLENHSERMLRSVEAIGSTIATWPQLGGTALFNGASIAYCVRRIVTGQPLISDRAVISLDERLDPTHNSRITKDKKKAAVAALRKIFTL